MKLVSDLMGRDNFAHLKTVKSVGKITNSIPNKERKRELRLWSMTIEDIYLGGEQNAISNINKWKERVRNDLRH